MRLILERWIPVLQGWGSSWSGQRLVLRTGFLERSCRPSVGISRQRRSLLQGRSRRSGVLCVGGQAWGLDDSRPCSIHDRRRIHTSFGHGVLPTHVSWSRPDGSIGRDSRRQRRGTPTAKGTRTTTLFRDTWVARKMVRPIECRRRITRPSLKPSDSSGLMVSESQIPRCSSGFSWRSMLSIPFPNSLASSRSHA